MIRTSFFTAIGLLISSWCFGQEDIKSSHGGGKHSSTLDEYLVARLDTIHRDDQQYRQQLKEIEQKFGLQSAQMRDHWQIIDKKDSLNLIKVAKILDERGWLGAAIVGNQGNETLFLVIQHADLQTQEKYLPMMRDAVEKGNARGERLALLEDRVAIKNGRKQIYGSQINRDLQTGEYYVLPLIDPDNVDKRRAEVGLGSLQAYIARWGMTWDVEAYKKKVAEYETKQPKMK